MRTITFRPQGLALGLAVTMALLAPVTASAQSSLDTSEAQAFLGNWTIAIDSDFGPFSMDLAVADQDGKVSANIGSPELGGPPQEITEIAKDGEKLVLTWEMDAQGQLIGASMSLEPNGDDLDAVFEVAEGQFMAYGTGTRAAN